MSSNQALGSRYELVETIGAGAMGVVWRTLDRQTGEQVAAKLLKAEYTSDHDLVGRFIQERSILLGLRHPSLVQVHDLVVEGQSLAIVMDLVQGGDLRGHLRAEGPLAPLDAVDVVCAVLDALAVAHEAGCLHRDVKPDNVLLAAGPDALASRVRLTDFGIARLAQDSTVQVTGLLGTPGYMPPELFSAGRFGAASDVYAVGVMLYELLAGRTPFAGPGTAHTLGFRHVTSAPPPLPVDPALWQVLSGMLAKDPSRRLPAAATAAALRDLRERLDGVAALPPQPEPTAWAPADDALGATPAEALRVENLDAGVDLGATRLKGAAAPAAPAALPGEVQAVVAPSVGDEAVDAVTNLRPRLEVAPPTLPSQAAPPKPPMERRTRLMIAGASAVAVLAVVGVVVAVTGGKDAGGPSGSAGGSAAAPAALDAWKPYRSGLRITPSIATEGDAATLTLALAADGALGGDALVVVPKPPDGGCDALTPSTGDGPVVSSLAQAQVGDLGGGCALLPALTDHVGGDARPVTLSFQAPGWAGDPGRAAEWAQQAETLTEAALASVDTTADVYAAQRVTGLCATVPSTGRRREITVRAEVVSGEGEACGPQVATPASGTPAVLPDVLGSGFTKDDFTLSIRGTDGKACPQVAEGGTLSITTKPYGGSGTDTCTVAVTAAGADGRVLTTADPVTVDVPRLQS
ncbi:serine/threonine protein kinase [Nocardioides sp. TRM66260-LWL]|uniref:serine/threonine-protein kinase n=1 Tax=Nocardioides sp. TRM66260-LWL TaxID=2874478 RepID=UPI001CC652CD|nr:serine/threonine-protein kinase [Nocardioides sp. TRM66260-LWL]MBZ5735405.1 serine/threonine protein kinase [Nocardioides sp. TRM66260-LWL]